ncbi:DUF2927 domain-containing protein [Natronohydrobacter thiooxidans]|uniref:DUF2927 domain-containing protein n=1 Tax=Natronohydrobacter thiooxidans TaxID=87172 RepID=UPI001586FDFA|nr:DUF2927 domain-containing protein [Natronohydrobacter thiooxidans]
MGPFLLALTLAACGAPQQDPGSSAPPLDVQTRAISSAALFGTPRPFAPERSNAQIAQDILELGFRLESGRAIPYFSRFEGPVALRLAGAVPPLAATETERLIARLRSEARLDIRQTEGAAQITVEFVPRPQMRRIVPDAACFVVPNVASWEEFRANPRGAHLDWTRIVQREKVLVVTPADSTVQEMRDCLHEEVAQALGPLNDLYRIGETVWNDDNFQTSLTGFDMLVLRVWNHPDLRPGMTREEVGARLPALLARLNPQGARRGTLPLDPIPTPAAWTMAIEGALASPTRRRSFAHAQNALRIALLQGWQDERLAFSLFLAARFAPPRDGEQALDALIAAAGIYASRPGGQVPRAHVELHLAAQALGAGQYPLVLRLSDSAMGPARRSENGALLSSLMLLRAQALERMGRQAEAERLRREAVPFAVYGFGSVEAATNRREEIAALIRQ